MAAMLRPLGGALLACAVFLGAVDYHPPGEVHSFGEAAHGSGVSFSPAAVHPGQPLHLEASDVVTRPHCPVCLHRLQTSGSHLQAVAGCPLPAPSSFLLTGFVPATTKASRHPREARGPPSV